jgi:hypothetical protein
VIAAVPQYCCSLPLEYYIIVAHVLIQLFISKPQDMALKLSGNTVNRAECSGKVLVVRISVKVAPSLDLCLPANQRAA